MSPIASDILIRRKLRKEEVELCHKLRVALVQEMEKGFIYKKSFRMTGIIS